MLMSTCNPLGLTTAISTLATAISETLGDDELELAAAMFAQLGDTLATIAVQRSICSKRESEEE